MLVGVVGVVIGSGAVTVAIFIALAFKPSLLSYIDIRDKPNTVVYTQLPLSLDTPRFIDLRRARFDRRHFLSSYLVCAVGPIC